MEVNCNPDCNPYYGAFPDAVERVLGGLTLGSRAVVERARR